MFSFSAIAVWPWLCIIWIKVLQKMFLIISIYTLLQRWLFTLLVICNYYFYNDIYKTKLHDSVLLPTKNVVIYKFMIFVSWKVVRFVESVIRFHCLSSASWLVYWLWRCVCWFFVSTFGCVVVIIVHFTMAIIRISPL